jgi:GNAT superfamily N-acetyltransferase
MPRSAGSADDLRQPCRPRRCDQFGATDAGATYNRLVARPGVEHHVDRWSSRPSPSPQMRVFYRSASRCSAIGRLRGLANPLAAVGLAVVEIRPFEERNRERVEALMDDFGDEIAAMDPRGRCLREPGYGAEFVRQMRDDASGPDGIVLVAEDDGAVVGFASGRVETRSERERLAVIDFRNGIVPELYVARGWRRRGVGRALLERLNEQFEAHGCGASVIEVFAPNLRARRFYAALGYEERDLWLYKWLGSTTAADPKRVRAVRDRLISAGVVMAPDGMRRELFPVAIGPAEGAALGDWVRREDARRTIESGLGFAISTLFICEGLLDNGPDGLHVAADPYQFVSLPTHRTTYDGVGLQILEEAGVRDLVEFYAEESQIVFPRLLASGGQFDLAFLDGNHRFEAVFLDLIYAGRLLKEGGVVFVDDTQLPGVERAAAFCVSNLAWTIEDRGKEDVHEWAVLRTGSHKAFRRPYTEFVDF